MNKTALVCFAIVVCATPSAPQQRQARPAKPAEEAVDNAVSGWSGRSQTQNRPERLEWFRDQGFGMFIHWSVDSQLGSVISHSMSDASPEYLRQFVSDLPKTFDPYKFDPKRWAVLAKLAGMRYVAFTTHHCSGFCMWDTSLSNFGLRQTPFRRDISAEVYKAFREQGIAPGLYYCQNDMHWLYEQGKRVNDRVPGVYPRDNPEMLAMGKAQVRELIAKYGPFDMAFLDGDPTGLKELIWSLSPDTVLGVRGFEQAIPAIAHDEAWESPMTIGTQWHYKPTNEQYKSGSELIDILVEIRAKGGNLLLNVGPKPDGELPIEQEERLREVALWMFANHECIYAVRPWVVTNEGDIWFTKKKDQDTVYAIFKQKGTWAKDAWRDITIASVKAAPDTEVTILGQAQGDGKNGVPVTTWKQDSAGLHIHAYHGHRFYNNSQWPNPIVLKITKATPALVAPQVNTIHARWDAASQTTVLEGELASMGDAKDVEVGFRYRPTKNWTAPYADYKPWQQTSLVRMTQPGPIQLRTSGFAPDSYEVQTIVQHPRALVNGDTVRFSVRPQTVAP